MAKVNNTYHKIPRDPQTETSYFESYKCKVCGKNKGAGNHQKCSRTLQQQRNKRDET